MDQVGGCSFGVLNKDITQWVFVVVSCLFEITTIWGNKLEKGNNEYK